MAVLDTTVFLDLRGRAGKKRQAQIEALLHKLSADGHELATTRINFAELLVGVELADSREREKQLVDKSLADINILEFEEKSALEFARIRADLQRRGRLIGDLDMLIAAIAVAHGQPVVTANARHFANIAKLVIIEYVT